MRVHAAGAEAVGIPLARDSHERRSARCDSRGEGTDPRRRSRARGRRYREHGRSDGGFDGTLALACVGIYAVISYSVEQRTREMGIRLALGAAPGGILGMVLREGLLLAASGIALGVLAAFALTRYLASLLYSVRPTDPAVFAAVSAILAIAAAAGCYFPARRATRVDPSVVLRED